MLLQKRTYFPLVIEYLIYLLVNSLEVHLRFQDKALSVSGWPSTNNCGRCGKQHVYCLPRTSLMSNLHSFALCGTSKNSAGSAIMSDNSPYSILLPPLSFHSFFVCFFFVCLFVLLISHTLNCILQLLPRETSQSQLANIHTFSAVIKGMSNI